MLVRAGEKVAAIGEADLAAELDGNLFEGFQGLLKDIHHSHLVCEADHDVETRGVEGERVRLVLEYLTDVKGAGVIVPDADSFVSTASTDKLLLNAHIHAIDGTGMEWEH